MNRRKDVFISFIVIGITICTVYFIMIGLDLHYLIDHCSEQMKQFYLTHQIIDEKKLEDFMVKKTIFSEISDNNSRIEEFKIEGKLEIDNYIVLIYSIKREEGYATLIGDVCFKNIYKDKYLYVNYFKHYNDIMLTNDVIITDKSTYVIIYGLNEFNSSEVSIHNWIYDPDNENHLELDLIDIGNDEFFVHVIEDSKGVINKDKLHPYKEGYFAYFEDHSSFETYKNYVE